MDLWNSAIESLNSLCSWSTMRAGLALVLAGVGSAYSTVSTLAHPSIPFLIALVCIDFALAAGIACYENRFTWPGFRHGLGKFVGYSLIFIITSIADYGMGIAGWGINLTIAMICYGIAGESISCLRHIDDIFPGQLPNWLIARLETVRHSIERDAAGLNRRSNDWRGYSYTAEAPQPRRTYDFADCRGRIPDDEPTDREE